MLTGNRKTATDKTFSPSPPSTNTCTHTHTKHNCALSDKPNHDSCYQIWTIYATRNVTVAGLHEERERKTTAAGVPTCYWDATGSNDDIRHVYMDAMTDCSTAPLPLRKCSACHSQYSLNYKFRNGTKTNKLYGFFKKEHSYKVRSNKYT